MKTKPFETRLGLAPRTYLAHRCSAFPLGGPCPFSCRAAPGELASVQPAVTETRSKAQAAGLSPCYTHCPEPTVGARVVSQGE